MRPGSISPDCTDIFQEGIIVPPVRLSRDGVVNEDLLRVFFRNSRFPDICQGDTRACFAAVRLGERRIVELAERFGPEVITDAFRQLSERSERVATERLRKTFAPGRYEFSDSIDHDGQGNGPYRIHMELSVDDNGVVLDYSDSDDQAPGPINYLLNPAVPRAMMSMHLLAGDPTLLLNAGAGRAIDKVVLREGSVLQPRWPAPLGQRGLTMMKLLSGSQGLVNAAGGQATAANCAYVIIFARGVDDNGEPFLLTDGIGVGYGGRPDSDGIDAVYYVAQENYPAEMVEMSYPARLRSYGIRCDSGGAGQWRGGCGVVWLAHDTRLDEQVAIKRLPPELVADPQALKDFTSEVQKAHKLSHPNIIRIHDLVTPPNELPFITMEFVDGSDLNTLREQQPNGYFTWSRLEGLASQLCEALGYAHQQQIIHRDLKPANMMITREGNLKLADFGIAASVADNNPKQTMEGDSSGTTIYMSPQQMQGTLPHTTDDIYALGATLYDLLTTRPPFYTGDVYTMVQNAPAPTISQRLSEFALANEVPPQVESTIMACLAKDPAERPADTATLSAILFPNEAPPPPPPPEYIPEMESVFAEPLEKTQQYLEDNLPDEVTDWWGTQSADRRDLTLVICLLIAMLSAELLYSFITHKGNVFKTIQETPFFSPF